MCVCVQNVPCGDGKRMMIFASGIFVRYVWDFYHVVIFCSLFWFLGLSVFFYPF